MNRDARQFDFLDLLAVMSFVIQVMDYDMAVKQPGSDDLLRELREDMAELRAQNREILQKLSE